MIREAGLVRKSLIMLLACLLSLQARGEDWASVAFTRGAGRVEIVTDYWLFSLGKSYDVQIPHRIEEGARIRISYNEDERHIETDFFVAGISTKGELCRVHNKLPSQHSTDSGDTIYIKPCRYE